MEESMCYKCSQKTLGCLDCCTSPFIGKDPGFWMTLSDVAKIVNATGFDPDSFCRFTTVDEDEDDEDEDLDEKHSDLMYQGDKVILMNGSGKCSFLGSKGCTIFNDRPKMCRIYPFWFNERKGKITITIEQEDSIEEDDCLITKANYGSHDIPHLLKGISETEKGMMELVKDYLKEMELHAKHKHELETKSILDVLRDNGFVDKDIKVKKKVELPLVQ